MLNLDDLLGTKKSVQWDGKEYTVNEPTLDNVLEAQRILESADENKQFANMGEVVKILIPGLDVSKIPARLLPSLFNYVINGEEKKTETPAETEVTEEAETLPKK